MDCRICDASEFRRVALSVLSAPVRHDCDILYTGLGNKRRYELSPDTKLCRKIILQVKVNARCRCSNTRSFRSRRREEAPAAEAEIHGHMHVAAADLIVQDPAANCSFCVQYRLHSRALLHLAFTHTSRRRSTYGLGRKCHVGKSRSCPSKQVQQSQSSGVGRSQGCLQGCARQPV